MSSIIKILMILNAYSITARLHTPGYYLWLQFCHMFQCCLLLQKEEATPAIVANVPNEIREQPPDEISFSDKMNNIICICMYVCTDEVLCNDCYF